MNQRPGASLTKLEKPGDRICAWYEKCSIPVHYRFKGPVRTMPGGEFHKQTLKFFCPDHAEKLTHRYPGLKL